MSESEMRVTLICAECDQEWPPEDYGDLDAREMADGAVCLTCSVCERDLAVVVGDTKRLLWRCAGSVGPMPCGHLNYPWESICWMCGRSRDGGGERGF